jgi:hypothetical protein
MKVLLASTAVMASLALFATSANAQYYQQVYAYPAYVASYGYYLQTPATVTMVAPAVQMAQAPVTQPVVVAAPVAPYAPQVVSVRLRHGDDESAKRCAFADDSIGYALNNYSQLLRNQLPRDMAKYYGDQMYAQTYNLRNHIRAIKYSGNAAVCEYEGDVAIRTIQSIYQTTPR